ncbi:uncharacterized protein CGFF_01299 [Nakaseomyces glabratus]|nr:uncharacterized protein CGFF_01299 [Nakaseomyces glabratus]
MTLLFTCVEIGGGEVLYGFTKHVGKSSLGYTTALISADELRAEVAFNNNHYK